MESTHSENFKLAAKRAPRFFRTVNTVVTYLTYDLFGGSRPWTAQTIIDLYHPLNILIYPILMWKYQNFSPAAFVFLAMHIVHELLWFTKNFTLPDPSWRHKITIGGGVFLYIFLCHYSIIGWTLVAGLSPTTYPLPDNTWFAICIVINAIGCMALLGSDTQKYFTLKIKSGLITNGFFKYIRHPNYLGQTLIYISFLMLSWHWLPTTILAATIFFVFGSNIVMKEASMSRYPEWDAYKKQSWWLIPGIF